MSKYIPFTDEQKRRANSIDIADFLRRQGEQLTRAGRDWRWKRHDSVTIRGNQWYRHSREEGGLAIDFVREFYGLSFPEAVTLLLGGEGGVEWNQTHKSAPAPRKPFTLPEMNSDMRRVYAYLIKQRFIDRDVIAHFAKTKMLYESCERSADKTKEYHNAWRRTTARRARPSSSTTARTWCLAVSRPTASPLKFYQKPSATGP